MYVHKYIDGGDTFYRVTKSSGKPAKTVTLSINDWKGKVSEHSGNVGRAMEFLKDAPWSVKEEKIEEEEGKRTKKAHIASCLDEIANEIQGQDPVVAMAIDKISNVLEK